VLLPIIGMRRCSSASGSPIFKIERIRGEDDDPFLGESATESLKRIAHESADLTLAEMSLAVVLMMNDDSRRRLAQAFGPQIVRANPKRGAAHFRAGIGADQEFEARGEPDPLPSLDQRAFERARQAVRTGRWRRRRWRAGRACGQGRGKRGRNWALPEPGLELRFAQRIESVLDLGQR
jgi:hypothetical protein